MAQRNKISPVGLFFILFISRTVVCLSDIRSISFGSISSDILISFVLFLGLTLVFSLPVIYCIKKCKNPFDIKWLSYLYFLYFILTVGIHLSRFSYFASTIINPETQS